MKPFKDINQVFTYPSERIHNHPSIEYIVEKYFPSLRNKVESVLKYKTKRIDKDFLTLDFYKNDNVLDLESLFQEKLVLKRILDEMLEILGDKKPIVFIADSCFTNDLFIDKLKEVLEDDFDKYVGIVEISYTDDDKNYRVKDYLYENSIVILGGSFSDLEDVPNSIFEGDLANFIKDVHNNKINSKLIGICWGQQLISSVIGFDEIFSERVTTTYKGVAQFGMMPGKLIKDINQVPYIYRNILNSITNNGKNKDISAMFTRTGHVDFNFLDSYTLKSKSTMTFLRDSITGSPLIWGTKNGNILGNQAHFEIDQNSDKDILMKQVNDILPFLVQSYGKRVENILYNVERENSAKNLFASFYVSGLISFGQSIIKKNVFEKELKQGNGNKDLEVKVTNKEQLKDFMSEINFGIRDQSKSSFELAELEGYMKLSTLFDWKVNRGIEDASDILGLDLEKVINEHKKSYNGNYVFRDMGAGNGKLVNDIENRLGVLSYGVADYGYFDIYESLIKLESFSDIPRNVLKIFVQELIENYKKLNEGSVREKVLKSLESITLNSKTYKIVSMFTEKTYRFNDKEKELEQNDFDFIENSKNRIEELKQYVSENFYDVVVGNFDNIIFSDFNSLYIPNSDLKQIDFQTAIRSTCHVDGKDLEKMLEDHLKISANPGSIYIDNGVVRSDSGVSRIKEYIDLEKNHIDVKVYFIYDYNTSYVTSAIILREPFADKEILENNLHEGYKLLTSEEINECSFFKVERFFRELMIFTFKDFKFNHDKNKEIVEFLKELSANMKFLDVETIRDRIIFKINTLIKKINEEYLENYSMVKEIDFDNYLNKVSEDIKEFFTRGK